MNSNQLVCQLVHYNNTIEQVMIVLEAVEQFIPVRARIIHAEASKLEEHNFNRNIAKVVGSGTGTAAGVAAFAMLHRLLLEYHLLLGLE